MLAIFSPNINPNTMVETASLLLIGRKYTGLNELVRRRSVGGGSGIGI